MSEARFGQIKLRAFVKSKKEMVYPNDQKSILIGGSSEAILEIDSPNIVYASGDDVVIMKSTGWRDNKLTDIYEGDLLFSTRSLKGGVLPIVGVVNARDFSFAVNTGSGVFYFDYGDKNITVLGNIFENTDEELAERTRNILAKFSEKKS